MNVFKKWKAERKRKYDALSPYDQLKADIYRYHCQIFDVALIILVIVSFLCGKYF